MFLVTWRKGSIRWCLVEAGFTQKRCLDQRAWICRICWICWTRKCFSWLCNSKPGWSCFTRDSKAPFMRQPDAWCFHISKGRRHPAFTLWQTKRISFLESSVPSASARTRLSTGLTWQKICWKGLFAIQSVFLEESKNQLKSSDWQQATLQCWLILFPEETRYIKFHRQDHIIRRPCFLTHSCVGGMLRRQSFETIWYG